MSRRREASRVVFRQAQAVVGACRDCYGAGCSACGFTGAETEGDQWVRRGRRLATLRRRSGLTRSAFERLAGLTPFMLLESEAGRRDSAEALGRLASGGWVEKWEQTQKGD